MDALSMSGFNMTWLATLGLFSFVFLISFGGLCCLFVLSQFPKVYEYCS